MDVQKGHDVKKYDPADTDQVRKIVDFVIEKIRLGWSLYGAKKGEDLIRIADINTIQKAPNKKAFIESKLDELDRFIMDKKIERKVLTPPLVAG